MSGDVQTLEAARRLSDLDRDLLLGRIQAFFALLERGDIDGAVDLVAPDIVCFPRSAWRHARYPRQIVGREAMREAFHQRHINYVTLVSAIHRIVLDADEVAVHRTTTIRERGGGVSYTFDCVNFLKFRDGLIFEFAEYPDGSAFDAVINFPH